MCNFLSLLSDGHGKIYYFDYKIRKKILNGQLNYELDSHTSIADYFIINEDLSNKWEYNPLAQKLILDQRNASFCDQKKVLEKCKQLDFKKIVPELIIKPIINPFNLQNGAVTQKDIKLLKSWAYIWDSVEDSIGNSVGNSVGNSIGNSVWDSVWDSVGAYVWDSVRGSVRGFVKDYIRAYILDSVGDSVWAYISSFFNLSKWKYINHELNKNPFQPCIDLWEKGLVPSYDGNVWRLHGVRGYILWEGEIK